MAPATAAAVRDVILERLDEQQWGSELIHHVYMGPLPAFFYPVFQLMDYSVHTWDAQRALGIDQPLSDLSAENLKEFSSGSLSPGGRGLG